MVTFARPEPTAGCLGGATLGAIDALVTWEGNWLLSMNGSDWDAALAADPRVMDASRRGSTSPSTRTRRS